MIIQNKEALFLTCLVVLIFTSACHNSEKKDKEYPAQIGDTAYNNDLDNPNFKLCDPYNTLHKRKYVTYKGGMKALKKELIDNYKFESRYISYNGYFVIRFAVNCNDIAGRYRMQTLDANLKTKNAPKKLKAHILSIFKSLKNWKHPYYEGKDYDGYSFITIKMVNGKIDMI